VAPPAGYGNLGGANSSGLSYNTYNSNPSSSSNLGSDLALGAGALGIAGALSSGKPTGYASAALQGTKLISGNSNTSGLLGNNANTVNTAAGYGANALGIYSGLKQGGVAGDASAATNAAQLGSKLGAFGSYSGAIGTAAGYVAAPLAVYNAVSNYKSGATGSDTLNGAEAGAAIGSIIPGVGTVVGGIVGGAVGAISSAFGPGAKDPETSSVQNVINATSSNGNNPAIAANVQNPYLQLAGLFDERSSTLPMYQKYGRQGEQAFTTDMTKLMNSALQSNPSLAQNPQAMYQQVVAPWVNSMGSGWSNVGSTYTATTQGLLQGMVTQYLNGTAAQNWQAVGGDSPFQNIYQGSPIQGTQSPSSANSLTQSSLFANTNKMRSAMGNM
jgi:hypothetical protein